MKQSFQVPQPCFDSFFTMVGLGKRSIFKLEVPSITSKVFLVGIFHEVESLVLHKHPKKAIRIIIFLYNFFMFLLSGHNMGTTLIVMLE